MESKTKATERSFSVELRSSSDLKSVIMANDSRDSVLVEGTIGELVSAAFVEGILLEVVGKRGVLRIDLSEDDVRKATMSGPKDVKRK